MPEKINVLDAEFDRIIELATDEQGFVHLSQIEKLIDALERELEFPRAIIGMGTATR